VASSKPLNWQISDIIQWYKKKELVVNETFQRYSVWSPKAKTFLIDTIIQELPLPKIYIRTKLDAKRQTSIREIVDGQQRIRTIVEFANNEFRLSSRSEHYKGFSYDDLSEDDKEKFLGYNITIEQLLNASDDDVIDIFARLNSYTVNLNMAEKRHAEFQTDFKFAIRKTSQNYRSFIEKFKVFTTKQRFRMADDEFFAEVYSVILNGITDGGSNRLYKLYKEQDDEKFNEDVNKGVRKKLDAVINYLDKDLASAFQNTFSKHYHLLMIIAGFLHHKYGIPKGQIDVMPERRALASKEKILDELSTIERELEQEDPSPKYKAFVDACSSSPHRIASRKIRFPFICNIFGAH
jgi:hypothetical protein